MTDSEGIGPYVSSSQPESVGMYLESHSQRLPLKLAFSAQPEQTSASKHVDHVVSQGNQLSPFRYVPSDHGMYSQLPPRFISFCEFFQVRQIDRIRQLSHSESQTLH